MRILLTGAAGQLGSALRRTLPSLGKLLCTTRAELDIGDREAVHQKFTEFHPTVIVNAAAYTEVDRAEREQLLAYKVNRDGPQALAEEAKRWNALLVHFSTDYVFDGQSLVPYVEDAPPNPLSVYGRSKLDGEMAVGRSGCRHIILRTSWIYSDTGKNFLLTMLRLAEEGRGLRVVNDQHGAPTSSTMIADALPKAIARVMDEESLGGTYHMSAGGSTTWFGFARAILGADKAIEPISSLEYHSPARRPVNSLLDNTKLNRQLGIRLPPWQIGLQEVMARMR